MELSSIKSAVLELPPSAVAFCPSHPEYCVVGTYFLHPKEDENTPSDAPQKRTGTLILYQLEGTELYVRDLRSTASFDAIADGRKAHMCRL